MTLFEDRDEIKQLMFLLPQEENKGRKLDRHGRSHRHISRSKFVI